MTAQYLTDILVVRCAIRCLFQFKVALVDPSCLPEVLLIEGPYVFEALGIRCLIQSFTRID